MIVAVFVLCGAVWAAWRIWPQDSNLATHAAVTPFSVSTTTTENTVSAIIGTVATHTATTAVTATTAATSSSSPAVVTLPSISSSVVPSTTNTTRWNTASSTVTTQSAPTTTTTTATTTTTTTQKPTTTTTTTTAPVKKYPAEWDTVYRSTTEDNLPIEEVAWTYKAAGKFVHITHYADEYIPYCSIERSETSYFRVPFTECIVITGFDAPTSNGIYRVPAAIDGKVVVGIDMRSRVQGARQFNDEDIAPTVKRIYLPPEIFFVHRETIDRCTELEAMYISSEDIWLEPESLPQKGTQTLYLYSITQCDMSCPFRVDPPVLWHYCEYFICTAFDCEDDPHYNGGYYKGATWQFSSFALWELYGPRF